MRQKIFKNNIFGDNYGRCKQCSYIFTSYSFQFYCCNRLESVCANCQQKVCKLCNFKRNTRVNMICAECKQTNDESEMFYDFKAKRIYCKKCMAKRYNYHYENMFKQNKTAKQYQLQVSQNSFYQIQDVIQFFKKWCSFCLKQFNKDNVFQMIQQIRVCKDCIQLHFDYVSPMLLFCIQCNGFINHRQEIQRQISKNQILCKYCFNYQKDIIRQSQNLKGSKQQSNSIEISNIKSASQLSRLKKEGVDLQIEKQIPSKVNSSILKVESKISVDQPMQNVIIQVKFVKMSNRCDECFCVFQKHQNNLKIIKKKNNKNMIQHKEQQISLVLCHLCYKELYFDNFQSIDNNKNQYIQNNQVHQLVYSYGQNSEEKAIKSNQKIVNKLNTTQQYNNPKSNIPFQVQRIKPKNVYQIINTNQDKIIQQKEHLKCLIGIHAAKETE